MVSLKDLSALDQDGSFDRIRKEIEESTSNEEERSELLTQVVVTGLVNHFLLKKARENQDSTKKATRVSLEKKKRPDKQSSGECFTDEEKNVLKKSNIIKNVKGTSSEIRIEIEKEAKQPKAMPVMSKNKNYLQELFSNRLPILPHDMKSHIQRKGIDMNDVKLVIVKELTRSDLLGQQGRLTMPVIQVISHEFLTDNDKQTLDGGGTVPVTLIEPCLTETPVNLRKWQLTSSWSYSLVSGWKRILLKRKVANGFKPEAILQVCWFRTDNGKKLWLALSIVDKKVVEGMRSGPSTYYSSDGSEAAGSSK